MRTLKYLRTVLHVRTVHVLCRYMFELELELIKTQMAQKPMLRAEVNALALRACQNYKEDILRIVGLIKIIIPYICNFWCQISNFIGK